jgi:hypothetical protein
MLGSLIHPAQDHAGSASHGTLVTLFGHPACYNSAANRLIYTACHALAHLHTDSNPDPYSNRFSHGRCHRYIHSYPPARAYTGNGPAAPGRRAVRW